MMPSPEYELLADENPLGTPVDFSDLTVLLDAWTGPGPAGAPVGRRLAAAPETFAKVDVTTRAESEATAPRQAAAYDLRAARREARNGTFRRLQATSVDRAMVDELETMTTARTSALARRRRSSQA